MLVKLTSSTSGEMIMFAEHAHRLFEAIGKETTARGVFTKEQLPDAVARLRRAVDEEKQAARREPEADKPPGERDEEDEAEDDKKTQGPAVSLGQRAAPLIRLMEWTLKEGGFILWEAPTDF